MRLVHAADLHLDSPLRGLSRLGDDDLAATLRSATRRALENLVDLVVAEGAEVLLLAGDVYDGDWHDYATGRFFVQQMDRLHDHGIPVLTIAGNHDAESEITRSLRLPPNVRALSTEAPETVVLDDLGLAVHGQGFATKAVLTNLAASYPHRVPGLLNVGLLHSSVEGDAGHDTYAPCSVADLTGLGYEYLALGHIHQQRVLADGEHTVAYSGNLQGRNPRETGPKGALVVDVVAGEAARLDPRPLDVARWSHVRVDVDGLDDLDAVLDAVRLAVSAEVALAHDRPVVARVSLAGRTPAAADLADTDRVLEELRLVGDRLGATVEKVRLDVRAPAPATPVDEELRSAVLAQAHHLARERGELADLVRPLAKEIGPRLREADLLDLADPAQLEALAVRAADELDALLRSGPGA